MKKVIMLLLVNLLASTANAAISYCPGTEVTGTKHQALQNVISKFAQENGCDIGTNCILNFAQVKYSIAWSKDCPGSARRGNDPKGSTFVCDKGLCTPLGFAQPSATY